MNNLLSNVEREVADEEATQYASWAVNDEEADESFHSIEIDESYADDASDRPAIGSPPQDFDSIDGEDFTDDRVNGQYEMFDDVGNSQYMDAEEEAPFNEHVPLFAEHNKAVAREEAADADD